jgi:hypothetical protein
MLPCGLLRLLCPTTVQRSSLDDTKHMLPRCECNQSIHSVASACTGRALATRHAELLKLRQWPSVACTWHCCRTDSSVSYKQHMAIDVVSNLYCLVADSYIMLCSGSSLAVHMRLLPDSCACCASFFSGRGAMCSGVLAFVMCSSTP